ncbi:MAG: hypothetical protein KF842_06315 [Caulobacter sp.]|nr:hypothetical protein [Caulobacter sp.]
MTVTTPSARFVSYAGDGGSGPFAIPFRFVETGDIRATLTTAEGVSSPLGGLTVSGAGEAEGGSVTTALAVAPGETLTLWSDTAVIQPADYIAADAFPAETHEAALDRLTLIAQDQARDIGRSLTAPLGESLGELAPAATRKGTVLSFDADTGAPRTDLTYAGLVSEIAGAIDGVATATGAVEAAGAAQIALVATQGAASAGALADQTTIALDGVAAAALEGASALGLTAGGFLDAVSAEAGHDEGWAITDPDGWTVPAWYTANSGVVGTVVRQKVPGADFSGLPSAFRIFEPPPVLPYDINIIVISGQSNSEDADAVPMLPRTTSDMVVMLDAIRPRHFGGTFGLDGFTPAASVEFISGTSHWGGNLAPAVGDMLEQLIAEVNGKTYAAHGKQVLPVHIGQSSSSIAQISHGTSLFTTIEAWFTAAKAAAVAQGKSIGIIAGAHLWGANGYDNNIGETQARSDIFNYWKAGGDVHQYLQQAILGLSVDFPVGIVGSHAHLRGGNDITPFVANAEAWLVATYPDKFQMVNGEGQFFFNGRGRGFGGSGVHHAAVEAALIGAHIGWWVHQVVTQGAAWNSCIPTLARTGDSQVTLSGLPAAGWAWDFYATGLPPTYAQANHGWFFYDPAAPTTEIALTRPPYPGAAGTLVADTVATLPANLSVRHGARASASTIAGNDIWRPNDGPSFEINGATYALHRNIPVFDKVVP